MPTRTGYFLFTGMVALFAAAVSLALFARASAMVAASLLVPSALIALTFSQEVAAVQTRLTQLIPWQRHKRTSRWVVVVWGAGVLILAIWLLFEASG